jgi:hypothetical protein
MSLDKPQNPGRLPSDDELNELAEKVLGNEEVFAAARKEYSHLTRHKMELQAQLDAAGGRNDLKNAAIVKELDDVEAEIRSLDQQFQQSQIGHAVDKDDLDEGIKRRLH